MTLSPLGINVPDDVLDDLRSRLARTRFTDRSGTQPWRGGADPEYLRELVTYWADGFDWRRREAELNAVPHYLADIAGCRLHFVHVRGERPAGRGGHFMPLEQPDLLADEMRAFFGSIR